MLTLQQVLFLRSWHYAFIWTIQRLRMARCAFCPELTIQVFSATVLSSTLRNKYRRRSASSNKMEYWRCGHSSFTRRQSRNWVCPGESYISNTPLLPSSRKVLSSPSPEFFFEISH
jgi:hypothetical protein